jgi:hypothetical protein
VNEETNDYISSKLRSFKASDFSSLKKEISVEDYKIVTTLEFCALIPSSSGLSTWQIVNLYTAISKEDYPSMIDIFQALVPKEKLEEFGALSMDDAIDVLNDWLGK